MGKQGREKTASDSETRRALRPTDLVYLPFGGRDSMSLSREAEGDGEEAKRNHAIRIAMSPQENPQNARQAKEVWG